MLPDILYSVWDGLRGGRAICGGPPKGVHQRTPHRLRGHRGVYEGVGFTSAVVTGRQTGQVGAPVAKCDDQRWVPALRPRRERHLFRWRGARVLRNAGCPTGDASRPAAAYFGSGHQRRRALVCGFTGVFAGALAGCLAAVLVGASDFAVWP